jgi:hypothetical protein
MTARPTGMHLQVRVRVDLGFTCVDPCENPYPPSGYRFLVGTGPGTSKSTQGLPVHFTICHHSICSSQKLKEHLDQVRWMTDQN